MFRYIPRIAICLLIANRSVGAEPSLEPDRPNFILIVCDNLGYGDVGCFGSKLHRTPQIDRMAEEGIRLTSFYVTSGVCSPSRASILTGCYPRRVNMHVNATGRQVLFAADRKGLHPDEITIAEVLKDQGYATAIVGKWHLGDQPPFLPTRQGFDYFFGLPYSDDMTATKDGSRPPLPLMENERVIEAPPDRIIDGHNAWPLWSGQPEAKSPYEAFFYYYLEQLQAVRSGDWKLYLPLEARWRNFRGDTEKSPARLYNLTTDLGETTNRFDQRPDIVRRLTKLAEEAREDLGDLGRKGKHQRAAGMVADPKPLRMKAAK